MTEDTTQVKLLHYKGFTLQRDFLGSKYLICIDNQVYLDDFCSNERHLSKVLEQFRPWVDNELQRIVQYFKDTTGEIIILSKQ